MEEFEALWEEHEPSEPKEPLEPLATNEYQKIDGKARWKLFALIAQIYMHVVHGEAQPEAYKISEGETSDNIEFKF